MNFKNYITQNIPPGISQLGIGNFMKHSLTGQIQAINVAMNSVKQTTTESLIKQTILTDLFSITPDIISDNLAEGNVYDDEHPEEFISDLGEGMVDVVKDQIDDLITSMNTSTSCTLTLASGQVVSLYTYPTNNIPDFTDAEILLATSANVTTIYQVVIYVYNNHVYYNNIINDVAGNHVNIASIIKDTQSNLQLMGSINQIASDVLVSGEHTVETVSSHINEMVNSANSSVRDLGASLRSAFARCGLAGVVAVLKDGYQTLSSAHAGSQEDVLEFTDNNSYMPQVFLSGVLETAVGSVIAAASLIVSVFSPIVGMLTAAIGAGAVTVAKRISDNWLGTYAHMDSFDDNNRPIDCHAIAFFQWNIPANNIPWYSNISKSGYARGYFEVPGGYVFYGPMPVATEDATRYINFEFHPAVCDWDATSGYHRDLSIQRGDRGSPTISMTTAGSNATLSGYFKLRFYSGDTIYNNLTNYYLPRNSVHIDPDTQGAKQCYFISNSQRILDSAWIGARIFLYSVIAYKVAHSQYSDFNLRLTSGFFMRNNSYVLSLGTNLIDPVHIIMCLLMHSVPGVSSASEEILLPGVVVDGSGGKYVYLTLINGMQPAAEYVNPFTDWTAVIARANSTNSDELALTLSNFGLGALYASGSQHGYMFLPDNLKYMCIPPTWNGISTIVCWSLLGLMAIAVGVLTLRTTFKFKRLIMRKRATNAAAIGKAWDDFQKNPTADNYNAYYASVKKNNMWANFIGGQKYSKSDYWFGESDGSNYSGFNDMDNLSLIVKLIKGNR